MSFALLGIRIRVAPSFFLFQIGLAVFISVTIPTSLRFQFLAFLIISAVVLVSVTVHEMGHALAARKAGLHPEVTLTWFGGFTRFVATVGPAKRLWISAAGVVYQAAMAGVVWVLIQQGLFGDGELLVGIAEAFVWFNLFMAGLNLIPVGGMDGGAILGSLLELLRVPRPRLVMLIIYGVGGLAITLWALTTGSWLFVLVGLYLTYAGVRGQTPYVRFEQDARANPELEATVRRLMLTDRHSEAAAAARGALADIDSAPYRLFATSVVLDALRLAGDVEPLTETLATLPIADVDRTTVGRAQAAAGQLEAAVASLLPPYTEGGDVVAGWELAKVYIAGRNPEAAATVVGYRPDLFHPLLGLDVHRRLVEALATGPAATAREILSAQRGAQLGATAHMLIAEGHVDDGLAILQRDHDLSANRTSGTWLDYGLTLAGRHENAVLVRADELPGRLEPEAADVLTYLLTAAKEWERAVEVGLPVVEDGRAPGEVLIYNVALALDAVGRLDEALALLDRLQPLFLLRTLAEETDDFGNLRQSPQYTALVERLATTGF